MRIRIYIVEDEAIKRETIKDYLLDNGFDVLDFENPSVALESIKKDLPDIVITDLRLPSMDGISFMKEAMKISSAINFIIITAYATVETAIEAMKSGAFDYLKKPFDLEELMLTIERLISIKKLRDENVYLKDRLIEKYACCNLVGKSKAMREIYDLIATVADSTSTVLIEGESGTGKEMVANAIHYNSIRKNAPFIKVSCSIFNPNILESELFGHEKGAFTGAIKHKKGKFELAHSGSIFLDDIDDIPLDLQVKLLRVLQEREVERVGGLSPKSIDVRVIAATKENLKDKVSKGTFREDLFYRLNVIKINLPPLRERKEDIPLLFEHFLQKYAQRDRINLPKVEEEALEPLFKYDWPGNVRELENFTERLVTLNKSKNVIDKQTVLSHLPENEKRETFNLHSIIQEEGKSFSDILEMTERKLLIWALEESEGNKSKAANLLKMKRTTFCDKLSKYEIE
ncbi:MAG: sigma-54-dependent Fis family transcriptional regulator [Candidatus Schekmanbacteria bacterium]|nr:MAG: sigma-54-dependent Fis family transcriptional regulator [Candidatus Schekmanbacteria bacterium]